MALETEQGEVEDAMSAEQLASCLVGYAASDENRVARLSKSHPVFSAIGLQRLVIAFLASGDRPALLVAGAGGSGKSQLMAEVERRLREALPLLSVHTAAPMVGRGRGRARAVALLREVWRVHGGADEEVAPLTPDELLHNGPSLLQRAAQRTAGIVLLLDDLPQMLNSAMPRWLPLPLPPGLHCVATASMEPGGASDQEQLDTTLGLTGVAEGLVTRTLGPLARDQWCALATRFAPGREGEVEAALATLEREGHPRGPRTCTLIASLVALKQDLPETGTEPAHCCGLLGLDLNQLHESICLAILRACKEQLGCVTVWVVALIAYATLGLSLETLAALCRRAAALAAGDSDSARRWAAGDAPLGAWLDCSGNSEASKTADILRVLDICRLLVHERVPDGEPSGGGAPQACFYELAGEFAHRSCSAFFSEVGLEVGEVQRLLTAHFTGAAECGGDARAMDEAASQLLSLADSAPEKAEGLISNFATRQAVMRHFHAASRGDEVIALWRRTADGVGGIGAKLSSEELMASSSAGELVLAGRLLSVAGEFLSARKLFERACNMYKKEVGEGHEREHAEALILLANNEVRYWDSRRDWANVEALRLLLDSSSAAVAMLQRRPPEDFAGRHLAARALSRFANGRFKAGCVSAPGSDAQTAFFDEADASIAEAVRLLEGTTAQILGEVVLVGGVTTLCRSSSAQSRGPTILTSAGLLAHDGDQALALALRAMVQFYHAEAILRASVGRFNEKSIYTHGNLAELFLYKLWDPLLGLLHLRMSCVVAVKVFGPGHANAHRKLEEFASLLHELRFHDWSNQAAQGRLEDITAGELVHRLRNVEGPGAEEISRELAAMSTAPPMSRHVTRSFWTVLTKDLGLSHDHSIVRACCPDAQRSAASPWLGHTEITTIAWLDGHADPDVSLEDVEAAREEIEAVAALPP